MSAVYNPKVVCLSIPRRRYLVDSRRPRRRIPVRARDRKRAPADCAAVLRVVLVFCVDRETIFGRHGVQEKCAVAVVPA